MRARLNRSWSALVVPLMVGLSSVAAADWQGYGSDPARDRVAESGVTMPMTSSWKWMMPNPPSQAWPGPAKWDAYNKVHDLKSRLAFDAVGHVAIGDELVYIGSSSDDKVYAIDRKTGEERWTFYTEGPVRFSPWIDGDRVLVGSDDGCLYCLDARTGELAWKQRPAGADRRIPGNGRIISAWPVRTGPVSRDGIVYCTAGLFPREGVFLSAYDVQDGTLKWSRRFDDLPAQGYILASSERLYVPTSRDAPVIFNRADGTRIGKTGGEGGTWALLTDDTLVYGPGKTGSVGVHDSSRGDQLATFAGNHMIVTPTMSYLHTDTELIGLDRAEYLRLAGLKRTAVARQREIAERLKNTDTPPTPQERAQLEPEALELARHIDSLSADMRACFKWKAPCRHPYAILLAGDMVLAGGDDEVAAYDVADGRLVWSAPVNGAAHGLAVDDGQLIVSTDTGSLECFVVEEASR